MEIKAFDSVSVRNMPVKRVHSGKSALFSDKLSVEEPLEIRITFGAEMKREQRNISVTMRTPGNDVELALGFLFTEGIIRSYADIKDAHHLGMNCALQKQNIIEIALDEDCRPRLANAERNFYTTSSCGVCGKGSIQSIRTTSPYQNTGTETLKLFTDVFYQLPGKLKEVQSNFTVTGGIHASGLFTPEGHFLLMREDVGRHNALDKLIGRAMADELLPLDRHILLLSGRASFELIQKAAMAGIRIIAAIGAPSSLAVELAKEFDITLLGFLKEDRYNIYHQSRYLEMV